MPKCRYCKKVIDFGYESESDRMLPIETGVKEYLSNGKLSEGHQVHTCSGYRKQHKRRQIIGKYSKGENPSVA